MDIGCFDDYASKEKTVNSQMTTTKGRILRDFSLTAIAISSERLRCPFVASRLEVDVGGTEQVTFTLSNFR